MPSLEDQIRSALDRVLVSLSGQLESELRGSHADILRAASDAQVLAVSEASERAAAESAERAAAEVRREAEQQLSTIQQEFARQRDELDHTRVEELARLQQTLEAVQEELDSARREIGEQRQEREAIAAQLDQSRHETDQARRESEERLRELEDTGRQLREVQQRIVDVQGEVERARHQARRSARLAQDLRTLDSARTLGDVLEALARLTCQEGGRTAVFLVNRGRLRGWRAVGFDTEAIGGAHLDIEGAGLLGVAVSAGRQDYRKDQGMSLPAFAGPDSLMDAVALPVEVAGSVIAVLYADAPHADTSEESRWADVAEMMTKYAGRLLEAMTVRHAAEQWTPGVRSRQTSGGPGAVTVRAE